MFRFALFVMCLASVSALGFDRRTPVVEVYEQTKDMVVNVSGKQLRASMGFDWSDPFGDSLFGPRYSPVLGSGVVVHENGYVITNAHVVSDTEDIKITFTDGKEYPARIISADPAKDIAFLKVDAEKKFAFIHLGSSMDLMVGETVIAIGNPFGYANTVTAGVISAKGRDIQVAEEFWLRGLIQTYAAINRGNSGGPLLNINGELIGITTAIRPDAQNIGFAIPVDTIADNLSQMLVPEKLRRVQLGLEMGRMAGAGANRGLEVASVALDSPAHKQGMKKGDIVTSLDGQKVTSFLDFFVKMIDKQVGEPIKLEYYRPSSGAAKVAELEMVQRPVPDGRRIMQEFFQMEVEMLDADMARKFGFDRAYPVLVVTGTKENGAAEQAGIKAGDLVLEIEGATVSSIEELGLVLEKINEGDNAQFRILQVSRRGFMQMQRQYVLTLKAQKGTVKEPARRPGGRSV